MTFMDTAAESPPDLYITGELARRRVPAADYLNEKRAIQELAARMAESPDEVLPGFVELAMTLTDGVSAGLSILEPLPAPGVFRWQHLKGVLARFEDATTPRDFSPCGITLDTNGPVLSLHPERFYSWISDADIVVPEVGHCIQNAAHRAASASCAGGTGNVDQGDESPDQEPVCRLQRHGAHGAQVCGLEGGYGTDTHRSLLCPGECARFDTTQLGAEGTPAKAADVGELLRLVLNPHEGQLTGQQSRFVISGPPLTCGEHALNGLALVFHELATNALKYGALADEQGRIDIRWIVHEKTAAFVWREEGGPAVTGAPQSSGFGSRLLQDTVEGQFQGTLAYSWNRDGLIVRMELRLDRLAY
jgi:hypothetical protein